ncbi:50S ribosomal protein L33 [Candidatus Gottesmanbacteria bacterium RIFCSPHIGHO2_01_FULL_47_48]|uniref:Large ribosomal subunit protein bL33 n=1 Tax=Candidatus Gottesmanbacteria bacterium RIFCSPHIGHO2_01_FULL_47_48 TaxID=1798381 RepID=A0A1F6A1M4_9BACT|nr:MAG: 50S ribosomal protein L33 [Candidatus Gottesmanbacteria bacterium RIFCSPHIGHO2_01_FULL_47_48]
MATKDATIKFGLVCTVCGSRNYVTSKNKLENKDKLTLKKYCRHCRKHTDHKENEKLGK